MALGWTMYYTDNNDSLVQNFFATQATDEWTVNSQLDSNLSTPSNWDVDTYIKKSPLYPYTGNSLEIWRCPADRAKGKRPANKGGNIVPRIRSLSMNNWVGASQPWGDNPKHKVYKKFSDMIDPGPSSTWVLIDEREDSINDGYFVVNMAGHEPSAPGAYKIVDYPASYHNRAAGVVFADTHSEIKKWKDDRTVPKLNKNGLQLNVSSPKNVDVAWFQERSTRLTSK